MCMKIDECVSTLQQKTSVITTAASRQTVHSVVCVMQSLVTHVTVMRATGKKESRNLTNVWVGTVEDKQTIHGVLY